LQPPGPEVGDLDDDQNGEADWASGCGNTPERCGLDHD